MIHFLILLAISPILIPVIAIAFMCAGVVVGLWFAAFFLMGLFQVFLYGWGDE